MRIARLTLLALTGLAHCHLRANAQAKIPSTTPSPNAPWMNTSLDSDTRADLMIAPDAKSVSFDLHNSGERQGDEIAQVYVTLPASAGEPFRKLAAWKRVALEVGESRRIEIPLDPLYLSIFSAEDTVTPGSM